jgi:hypothetical protein
MSPQELLRHKKTTKELNQMPVFASVKKNALPKPLHRLGGARIKATKLIDLSGGYAIAMYWRDGEILTDTAFYAHLFIRQSATQLYPVFEFHWHPNHKGVHCKTPCKTTNDFTNRQLSQGVELAIKAGRQYDPRSRATAWSPCSTAAIASW